jgi:hypothetical protein
VYVSFTCMAASSVLTRDGPLLTGKEYTRADFRWGVSDPTVVSLEILTVLGAGPIGCYILKKLIADDPARYYWLVVLSTAELYGGYVNTNNIANGFHIHTIKVDDVLS